MPTYTFINTETNEKVNVVMTVAERDEYLENNPHIKQGLATPSFGDPARLGVTKTPDSFNSLLKHVKSCHLHSNVNTRN